jgi:hypothetical protein
VHAWLTHVAQAYGLKADRLLGHLLRARNKTFSLRARALCSKIRRNQAFEPLRFGGRKRC